jgi:hypothetical protein
MHTNIFTSSRKRPLGRARNEWEVYVIFFVTELEGDAVDCIRLLQDRISNRLFPTKLWTSIIHHISEMYCSCEQDSASEDLSSVELVTWKIMIYFGSLKCQFHVLSSRTQTAVQAKRAGLNCDTDLCHYLCLLCSGGEGRELRNCRMSTHIPMCCEPIIRIASL